MTTGHELVRSIFARWQAIEAEKQVLGEDSKELFQEAKSQGLDTKALRAAFRQKVKDDQPVTAEMQEHDALVDLYLGALGTNDAHARDAREEGLERTAHAARAHTAPPASAAKEMAGTNSHAKASVGNGGGAARVVPTDKSSMSGDASRASGGAGAAASIPAAEPDLTIPTFLQRGHPDCPVKGAA